MGKALLMQGNQALAEGALAAGVRFFAGYPITPSTEIAEIMAERLPALGGKFIQMEDEIASMAAICGASLTGMKVLTATSGPGFSLKQELIGYAVMAEIPAVIVNVQRLGPSTGKPTAPAQADVMQARWGTHGDHAVIALSPSSVRECFDVGVKAVNFAEQFRIPVILLLDEIVGHMRERVELPTPEEIIVRDRKRPQVSPAEYQAYRPEADGVPPMADFGTGYYYHVTGLMHDERGLPTGNDKVTEELIRRLHAKLERASQEITLYEEMYLDDAEIVIVTYGCSARPAMAAVKAARAKGIKAGMLRLVTIWPFPDHLVSAVARRVKKMIVAEMNYGQLVGEVRRASCGQAGIIGFPKWDSTLFTPAEILQKIERESIGGGVNA